MSGGGGVRSGGRGWGAEGRCRGGGREDPVGDGYERRIKIIVKIQKKRSEGVKVRSGMGVGRGGWSVAMLGVRVNVGYGGCEPTKNRMYCTMCKNVLYNIKKIKEMCGVEERGNN